jgi:hypothetical protein
LARCNQYAPTGPTHPFGSQSPGAASPERASVRLLRLTCRRNRTPEGVADGPARSRCGRQTACGVVGAGTLKRAAPPCGNISVDLLISLCLYIVHA